MFFILEECKTFFSLRQHKLTCMPEWSSKLSSNCTALIFHWRPRGLWKMKNTTIVYKDTGLSFATFRTHLDKYFQLDWREKNQMIQISKRKSTFCCCCAKSLICMCVATFVWSDSEFGSVTKVDVMFCSVLRAFLSFIISWLKKTWNPPMILIRQRG